MAAPIATPRVASTKAKLGDGFKTLITLAANTAIEFWEDSVTPPSLDGGDAIESSTMFNIQWRNKAPRKLITMGDVKVDAQYNPSLYSSILALINVQTTVTIDFPDHSTLAFYGFLRLCDFAALTEGSVGKCSLTIVVTNYDPVNNVEAAPVYTMPGTAGFTPMNAGEIPTFDQFGPRAAGQELVHANLGGFAATPDRTQSGRAMVRPAAAPVFGGPVFGSPPDVPPDTNYADYFAEQQRQLNEQMSAIKQAQQEPAGATSV